MFYNKPLDSKIGFPAVKQGKQLSFNLESRWPEAYDNSFEPAIYKMLSCSRFRTSGPGPIFAQAQTLMPKRMASGHVRRCDPRLEPTFDSTCAVRSLPALDARTC